VTQRVRKSRKAPESVAKALDHFLADLTPVGADGVRAALARQLAAATEEAPPYALARIANALAALLDELGGREAHSREAEKMLEALTNGRR
jgi:hypothetical protein